MLGIDAYVKLLLHLDNNVIDSSLVPKIVTNTGVVFSDSSPKFSHYGVFNGSSAFLTLDDSDDWNLGAGEFTVDFWINFPNAAASSCFWSQGINSAEVQTFFYDGSGLGFRVRTGDANLVNYYVAWGPSINTWYHIALVRDNSATEADAKNYYCKMFINGAAQSLTQTTTIKSKTLPNTAQVFRVGFDQWQAIYMYGNIDEFRLSKGVARWTADFTPPISPYASKIWKGQPIII